MLQMAFQIAQVAFLGVAFPLSVIAARGYRGSPFGAVLLPFPVIILAYTLHAVIHLLEPSAIQATSILVVNVVGLLCITYAAVQFVFLVTERRAL